MNAAADVSLHTGAGPTLALADAETHLPARFTGPQLDQQRAYKRRPPVLLREVLFLDDWERERTLQIYPQAGIHHLHYMGHIGDWRMASLLNPPYYLSTVQNVQHAFSSSLSAI